jgi:PAS domain S-box-containing protein
VEVVGKSVLSYIHPDDLDQSRNTIETMSQGRSSQLTMTFRLRHKDGHYLWFESTVRIVRNEKTGQVREYLCISRDITSRKSVGEETCGD